MANETTGPLNPEDSNPIDANATAVQTGGAPAGESGEVVAAAAEPPPSDADEPLPEGDVTGDDLPSDTPSHGEEPASFFGDEVLPNQGEEPVRDEQPNRASEPLSAPHSSNEARELSPKQKINVLRWGLWASAIIGVVLALFLIFVYLPAQKQREIVAAQVRERAAYITTFAPQCEPVVPDIATQIDRYSCIFFLKLQNGDLAFVTGMEVRPEGVVLIGAIAGAGTVAEIKRSQLTMPEDYAHDTSLMAGRAQSNFGLMADAYAKKANEALLAAQAARDAERAQAAKAKVAPSAETEAAPAPSPASPAPAEETPATVEAAPVTPAPAPLEPAEETATPG